MSSLQYYYNDDTITSRKKSAFTKIHQYNIYKNQDLVTDIVLNIIMYIKFSKTCSTEISKRLVHIKVVFNIAQNIAHIKFLSKNMLSKIK